MFERLIVSDKEEFLTSLTYSLHKRQKNSVFQADKRELK